MNRRRWLLLVIVIVALLAAPWLLIREEPLQLDDAARASGSRFVALSAGQTHYDVTGAEDGPTVVLVHGTTTPAFGWERNVEPLANAGFRVVWYDLYGRGLSDRVDAGYGLDLYVTQLREMLDQVAPAEPVDLVGFSLGGMIVSEFANRHPDRVRRVALIAPAGVGTDLPLVAKLAVAPVLGEYLMRVNGTRHLRPTRRDFAHPERHTGFDAAYFETIRFEGSRRAVLETLRSVPFNAYEEGFQRLGDIGKPLALIWGRQDAVVPFSSAARVRELARPSTFVAVDDAGHMVSYEQPDIVNAALIEFFAR